MRVVVVGNGMAGFRFVQELLELGPCCDVTVVGAEPGGAYNRARLPEVLAGTASEDSIELADPDWYAARGVRLLAGVTATRIDRAQRRLVVANGQTIRYDKLVLAAGSVPAGPELRPLDGVVAFRGLADCAEIRLAAGRGPAAVLGGGVLGLETACALAMDGRPVTVIQRGPRLMERQLDAAAARVLDRTVRSLGVTVRTGVSIRGVRGAGSVTGVELDDGTRLVAGLVVLCCGTRPRADLASAAGLAVRAGVVVDDQMRSVTDPRILAIGDCAEHRGRVNGLVAPAWAQARVAAMTVAGQHTAGYAGTPAVVRLKAAGIELAALGSARAPGAEVIRFTDPSRGVYQKLVVRNGQLAGAILLGDTRTAGTLTQLFDRGAQLPADRSSLLVTRSVAASADTAVCECNNVSGAAISAAWRDGARDAGQIAARTRATTGCGTCREAVEGILARLAATDRGLVPA